MAFDNTVPAAGIDLNETIVPIQENFAAIQTAFDINHGSLTDIQGNAGKHMKVSFKSTTGTVDSTLNSFPLWAGNFDIGAGNTVEMARTRINAFGEQKIFPLTKAKFDSSSGYTFIGDGSLLILWENFTINSRANNQQFTFTGTSGATLPDIVFAFYGHVAIRSRSTPTTSIDAAAYFREAFIENNRVKLNYTLRKRSEFSRLNDKVLSSDLPLRAHAFAICLTRGE